MVTKKRRAWGSGSIVERKPGVWRVRYPIAPDPRTGKRRERTLTVHGSKRDAQAALTQLSVTVPRNPTTSATVQQLMDEWWRHVSPGARPNTAEVWLRMKDRWIIPTLGKRTLRTLRAPEITAWHRTLAEAGATWSQVLAAHSTLSAALTFAGRMGWMSENPCRLAGKPPSNPKPTVVLEASDLRALLDAARDPLEQALVRLAIVTGARRNELLALRWTDIDLDAGEITVARSLVIQPGRWSEGPTKTGKDRRPRIDPVTAATLLTLAGDAQRRGELGEGFVFSPGDGLEPMTPRMLQTWWERLRDNAGVTARFHDLRHATVQQMRAAGIPVKAVGKHVGQQSAKVTDDIYNASLKGDEALAPLAIAAVLDASTH